MLKKLYIHNFKSFWNSTFEFGKVNCLIAPNNAGKSNLIEAIEFLDNLIYQNPVVAMAKVGLDNIKNYHYVENETKLNAEFEINNIVLVGDELLSYKLTLSFIYSYNWELKTQNIDVFISGKIKNILINKADLKKGMQLRVFGNFDNYIDNFIIYAQALEKNNNRSFNFDYNHSTLNYSVSNTQFSTTDEMVRKLLGLNVKKKNKELDSPIDFRFFFNKSSLFASHYFQTHEIKRPEITGYEIFVKNGKNLPEYLKSLNSEILEDITTSLVGEIELINNFELEDKIVPELVFKEDVNGKTYPIKLKNVSDGTLHFMAIMSALLGNKHSIGMMIEEPERHMHMKVLSYILQTMRNDGKQIFFSTHSTEILQQLNLDEIVFMFRDFDGNTKGKRAKNIENIKRIMKLFKNDLVEMIQMGVLGEYDE